MPRAGWVKPESDQRLSDHISVGVLTRTYPPGLVDRVLAECGRAEKRHRLLPARVRVYYAMALALFSEASYEEVMRSLVEGLDWASGWRRPWTVPSQVAITKARARLGSEPVRSLYERVARPLGRVETEGAFLGGLRLMAIDLELLKIRRPRSLSSGARALNRSPINASSTTPESSTAPSTILHVICLRILGTTR